MRHPRSLLLLLSFALLACSSGDGDSAATTTSAATAEKVADTAAPAVAADVASEPPQVLDATVEMSDDNVLRGTLHVTTDAPAVLQVSLVDGSYLQPLVTTTEPATDHTLPLRGLVADRRQQVEIVPIAADGTGGGAVTVDVQTEPLPFVIPELTVPVNTGDAAPGYTMFSVTQITDLITDTDGREQPGGILLMVDPRGEVVWYHTTPRFLADARILPDGRLLYETDDMRAEVGDLDGNVAQRFVGRLGRPSEPDDVPTIEVDTDTIHHEVGMLPNGNFIALTTTLHTLPMDEPQCGEEPGEFDGEYLLITDQVIEIDSTTGEVLKRYDLFDLLDPASDPQRRDICGTDFQNDNVFPVPYYSDAGKVIDWTHANAVVLDEERNALLVSIRHLDEVVAIRYDDDADGPGGELLWELGEDGTIPFDGEVTSHQHAVELEDNGSILLYDNGNQHPEPQQSRAVWFDVDTTSDDLADWTASQRWEFRSNVDGTPSFAIAVGDVDREPNGNVLITNGFYAGSYGGLFAQIVEVAPEGSSGGTVVWELRVGGEGGWFVYRAERVPSLYPDFG